MVIVSSNSKETSALHLINTRKTYFRKHRNFTVEVLITHAKNTVLI